MRSKPTATLTNIGKGEGQATKQQQEQEDCEAPDLLTDQGAVSIPQGMLRKYIQYARTFIHPKLRGFDQDKVSSLYVDLRRESANSGGVPIAVRHIESIMRMSEAHAKLHLREHVREDDVDAAIKVMLESFIQAQKFSVRRSLTKGFRKYLNTSSDKNHLLLHTLGKLVKEKQTYMLARGQTPVVFISCNRTYKFRY